MLLHRSAGIADAAVDVGHAPIKRSGERAHNPAAQAL
jgi:hypothetical protein